MQLSAYFSNRNCDSDEEVDASSSIFDSFLASSVVKMCNFTPSEFHQLYSVLHNHISDNWSNCSGKKSDYKPVDVLFMMLVVMKHGGSWDQLGTMFRIKGLTFQRLITKFMSTIEELCVQRYVTRYSRKATMSYCHEHKYMSEKFPYALESVGVTFKQANRPSGNHHEGKKYFSGKHKLYGFKVEVCVRPNGLASDFSPHYPGSTAEKSIFMGRIEMHRCRLKKNSDDDQFIDNSLISEQ